MTPVAELPGWAALLTAALTLSGAGLTLVGAMGLLRLRTFYQRVHAPTLGTTMGAGLVLAASMVCFSVLQSRPVLHEILVAVFVTVTTPITLMLVVRAALSRDLQERNPEVGRLQPATRREDVDGSTVTGRTDQSSVE
jgi:multicomponent K+:H+ antiporter subunit G